MFSKFLLFLDIQGILGFILSVENIYVLKTISEIGGEELDKLITFVMEGTTNASIARTIVEVLEEEDFDTLRNITTTVRYRLRNLLVDSWTLNPN